MIKVKTLGAVILAVGAVLIIYSLTFDTSVYVPSKTFGEGSYKITTEERYVHNIGLMNEKQNWLIFSSVVCIAGLLMYLLGKGTIGSAGETEYEDSEDDLIEEEPTNEQNPNNPPDKTIM